MRLTMALIGAFVHVIWSNLLVTLLVLGLVFVIFLIREKVHAHRTRTHEMAGGISTEATRRGKTDGDSASELLVF